MTQTPREIVKRCLTFDNPERMPRHLWLLPWAEKRFPDTVKVIRERYPDDVIHPPAVYKPSPIAKGNRYDAGICVDEWGCVFENIQEGVIGEVKDPIVKDINDLSTCNPPFETLPDDWDKARDIVNKFCAETDKFVLAGCLPRPWERMQFLRGTENAMMDTAMPDSGIKELLKKLHDFYMAEMEFWVTTDVDTMYVMDDWGSQSNLLISPESWRDLFKHMYKDYCDIAKAHNKFIWFHTDGWVTSIFEDLIELGFDAINSQLFTMDIEKISSIGKGKVTFWGEIDRQHIMPSKDPEEVRKAVRLVAEHLYDPSGGIILQFEMGPGVNPDNALIIYEEWDRIQSEKV